MMESGGGGRRRPAGKPKGANLDFIQALAQIEDEKGIPVSALMEAIEQALVSAYRRNFGTAQNVRVELDADTGDFRVLALREVVEEVTDPAVQISLGEAREMDPSYDVGDIVETEVTPSDFGRIAAQTAKQVVLQRIREAERGIIFEEYSQREGDIVTGVVQRQEYRNYYINLGKTEAVLTPSEQIPGERLRPSERVKVYIVEVKRTTKGPQIYLSRTHPGLVKRLFELEVPEIHDGLVEIRAIAREPGSRTKVAVASRDPNVDPVGACVGAKGVRVQAVVHELKGEKIDVVPWSEDEREYVGNALRPAKVLYTELFPEEKTARVVVPDHQLSLAIGREGQNARLAAKLTGWKIDIKSESQVREEEAAKARSVPAGPDQPLGEAPAADSAAEEGGGPPATDPAGDVEAMMEEGEPAQDDEGAQA
jgi:N utilization substance protein A